MNDVERPVRAVCRYTRRLTTTVGAIFLFLCVGPLLTARSPAGRGAAALTTAASLAVVWRALLVGTVDAAEGSVVIRGFLRTHRYAATEVACFAAVPALVGARKRLVLALELTSGGHRQFPDFASPRSGRGSALVPDTAAELNRFLDRVPTRTARP